MSSTMRYSPRSSVTALRTFSMRTGLDASTVTPGKTAPEVQVTTPERLAALNPCAAALCGNRTMQQTNHAPRIRPTNALSLIFHLIPAWKKPADETERRRMDRRESAEGDLDGHVPHMPHERADVIHL